MPSSGVSGLPFQVDRRFPCYSWMPSSGVSGLPFQVDRRGFLVIVGCHPCVYSPYPEEGLEFITLWCRMVNVSAEKLLFQLRDFPMPLLEVKALHLWGRLIGAEQESAVRG